MREALARRLDGAGISRGRALRLTLDGEPLEAFEGETVAAAILASGRRILRRTGKAAAPRSLFCGIGICHECRMTVDGRVNVRTCVTAARDGMVVRTQLGTPRVDPP